MTLEEYLKSKQARDTVDSLFKFYPDQTLMNTLADFRGQWEIADAGAWRAVSIYGARGVCDPRLAAVYYRPDGERFIVNDMGDGLRALRLRTGRCFMTFPELRETFERTPELPGVGFCTDTALYAIGDKSAHVLPGELPDAICRVLLASYRVANL